MPWKIYREWPFSAEEAKRRQEETAKGLGVPVEKRLDLGNGVQMEGEGSDFWDGSRLFLQATVVPTGKECP